MEGNFAMLFDYNKDEVQMNKSLVWFDCRNEFNWNV